jgi:hypothetical protein
VGDQPRPLQVTTSVLAFISTSLRRSTLPRSLDSSSSTSSWSNSRRMLPAGASRSMAMSSPASPTEISAVLSADQPVERHVAFGKWHSNHPTSGVGMIFSGKLISGSFGAGYDQGFRRPARLRSGARRARG